MSITKNTSNHNVVRPEWAELSLRLFFTTIEYAYYRFKNSNEANRASRTANAVFDDVDYEIEVSSGGAGENLSVDGGKKDITKIHKELLRLYRPKVLEIESFNNYIMKKGKI